ncbi:MAG: DUF1893 domain-containing protein [Endomicrobium sp.]|jgi:hypothetical protein|nr:DUF1893 domain-containing protein [Endomicrobium sp.]
MKRQSFLTVLAVFLAFFGCAVKKNVPVDFHGMRELLKSHTLVVAYKDGTVKTYDDKGIKPLFRHLEKGNFKNTYVFDKVTGKASLLVLVYGGAAELYTGVLSKEAIPVLEKYNVRYSADKIVDYILNEAEDGKCPMEKAVADIDDPQEAYKVLKENFGK